MRGAPRYVLILAVLLLHFTPASGQGGWLLVIPPVDEALIAALGATASVMRGEPPRDPSKLSASGLARAQAFLDRMAKEPSQLERVKMYLEVSVLKDAPIETWTQDRAFDSAAACESYNAWLGRGVRERLSNITAASDDFTTLSGAYRVGYAKCVPARAIYPVDPERR